MGARYDNIGGVQHKVSKRFVNIGGVQHPVSKRYDNIDAVWRLGYTSEITWAPTITVSDSTVQQPISNASWSHYVIFSKRSSDGDRWSDVKFTFSSPVAITSIGLTGYSDTPYEYFDIYVNDTLFQSVYPGSSGSWGAGSWAYSGDITTLAIRIRHSQKSADYLYYANLSIKLAGQTNYTQIGGSGTLPN